MTTLTPVTADLWRRWWLALTVALAVGYLVIGVLSAGPSIRWPFVIGAMLVLGALVAVRRSRPAAWSALVIGALAPVPTTWWSVAGPVTALLLLGCGAVAIRATEHVTR